MIEIEHKSPTVTEKLNRVKFGSVFLMDNDFYIKSDETDGYGDPQCVRLRDGCLVSPDEEMIVQVANSVKMEVAL